MEDLASDGFGEPWGHTRSYSNQLSAQDQGINGNSWFVRECPQIGQDEDGNIAVIRNIEETVWFTLVAGTPPAYEPQFFIQDTLVHDPVEHEFVHTDGFGKVTRFFDFTVSPELKRGQFKSFTDAQGHRTDAEYDSNGRIVSFVQASGTKSTGFFYAYNSDGRLESVTLRIDGSNDAHNVRRAVYEYHDGEDDFGSLGDLKLVTIEDWDDDAWVTSGRSYYRYYVEGETNGFVHGLKFALGKQGYARMLARGITPDIALDDQIAGYADNYFEYDSETKEAVLEKTGGGTLTFPYARTKRSGSTDFNEWETKTVETLPDGSQNIVFTNPATQPLLKVFKAGDDEWFTFFEYDGQGRLTLRAESSAVESYQESNPALPLVTLKADDGLIHVYEYYDDTDVNDEPALNEGEVRGYLKAIKVRKGEDGNVANGGEFTVKEWKYISRTVDGAKIYPVWKEIAYQSETDGGSDPATTEYNYTWQGSFQVLQKTTIWPVIAEAQNGSGVPAERVEVFDAYGRNTWLKDERLFLTRWKYDRPTGAVTQEIRDVDTAQITDEPAVPSGWETPEGGGLHVVTDYQVDRRGRILQELGPLHHVDINGTDTVIRRAQWFVYLDQSHETWEASGYQAGTTSVLINPVTITRKDAISRLTDEIQAQRNYTNGKLLPTDSFPRTTWTRWKNRIYNHDLSPAFERIYHKIPAQGVGNKETNFAQTEFRYDANKRLIRVKSPGGTITRTVFNPKGWRLETWVGTNDSGATEKNPGAGGRGGNNMRRVESLEYDDGNAGGDGNLTSLTQYESDAQARVTTFDYDFRNRRIATDGEVDFYEQYFYDNLDRQVRLDRKDSSSTGNLVARTENLFDSRGQMYRRIVYAVDPADGSVGNSLTDNFWFDPTGNTVRTQPAGSDAFQLMAFDGLNRQTVRYTAFGPDNVDDDTVLEQEETTYDSASNVIHQVTRERFHNATGTGPLTTPGGSQPKARVSYLASYPDPLGRVIHVANYGTAGGVEPDWSATCPAPSNDVLVTSTSYNGRGEAWQVTDPKGTVRRAEFDDAGRLTKTIENYQSSGTGNAINKTTRFAYNADGNLSTLIAVNADTGDQVTTYVYGTTLNDSAVASGKLLRKVIYPDSNDSPNPPSGTDHVEYAYNRLGERTQMKDQRGVIHNYDYDKLGRLIHDRVTLPGGSAVDNAVLRISRTYEVRGMLSSIKSYNNATVGSGAVVNESAFTYNDFAQLIKEEQAHGGAVGSAPSVQYGYADGSANTVRPTTITYPDGRVLHFDYGG